MNKQTTIYIVRHGQAEFNIRHIIGGTLDPNPLTEKGEEQARKLGEKFKNIKIDKIYSSDLLRAQKTAETIASMKNLPVNTNSLLRERSWGILQGKKFDEAKKKYPEVFLRESKIVGEEALDFKYVEDMESLRHAVLRLKRFIEMIGKNQTGRSILVVTHFDIMIGYLVYLRLGTYQELMNADLDHAGYYKLVRKEKIFIAEKIVGLHTKGY